MKSRSAEHSAKMCRGDENTDPLGFNSNTAFTLKRVGANEDMVAGHSPSELEISSVLNPSPADDIESVKRNLKLEHRPWIVYEQLQSNSHSDSKLSNPCFPKDACLQKGVIRGCSDCSDCQKVSARWNPEAACSYELEEAPVFHPSYEEFKDTLKYIDSIRPQVEPYGLCRIVPPPSWKPSCFLEEDDIWQSFKFQTQMQQVSGLQNHHSSMKAPAEYDNEMGDRKRRKLEYESSDGCAANFSSIECHGTESLQNGSCPEFNLIGFKRYADNFKQSYFSRESEVAHGVSPTTHLEQREPSEQSIEGEYWRIVEKPTEEIEVICGTGGVSSGSTSLNKQQKLDLLGSSASVWNLNSISSLPGSLLSFEKSDLTSIPVPQQHIGMCFSSVPWTLEEHCLYGLRYLHLGAPRIWYSISECDALEFEAIMNTQFRDKSEENRKLIPKLGIQPSLGTLKSEGVPVYRCVQRPGDFVLFLPGVYYSGFDCGFNFSESAVFAPLYWLPHGLTSTEHYRERKCKMSISYDKLLLRAANEVVKARFDNLVKGEKTPKIMMWKQYSGKDGVVTKSLRARIRSEARCRQYLSPASRSRKMDKSFDAGDRKRECCICFYDLYLSAAACQCNPNKYACLAHAKYLCSCSWSDKLFLFRYQINELNILAEAVEGKISPMRDWIRQELGRFVQCDEHDQGPNALTNLSSVAEASDAVPPSLGKTQASSSMMLPTEKDPVLEELFSDDFKEKAVDFIFNSPDDSSSSSSSDIDLDATIAYLESQNVNSVLTASKRQR